MYYKYNCMYLKILKSLERKTCMQKIIRLEDFVQEIKFYIDIKHVNVAWAKQKMKTKWRQVYIKQKNANNNKPSSNEFIGKKWNSELYNQLTGIKKEISST